MDGVAIHRILRLTSRTTVIIHEFNSTECYDLVISCEKYCSITTKNYNFTMFINILILYKLHKLLQYVFYCICDNKLFIFLIINNATTKIFIRFNFSTVKTALSNVIVNWIFFFFGQMVGQSKAFKDVLLAFPETVRGNFPLFDILCTKRSTD